MVVRAGNVRANQKLVRSINLTLESFRATNATAGTTPGVVTFRMTATSGQDLPAAIFWPQDFDPTVAPTLDLFFALVNTETDGDSIDLTLDYIVPTSASPASGVLKTSTQLTASIGLTTATGLSVGDMYRGSFSFSPSDTNNPIVSTAAGLIFSFHLTNLTTVSAVDFVGARFNYGAKW